MDGHQNLPQLNDNDVLAFKTANNNGEYVAKAISLKKAIKKILILDRQIESLLTNGLAKLKLSINSNKWLEEGIDCEFLSLGSPT